MIKCHFLFNHPSGLFRKLKYKSNDFLGMAPHQAKMYPHVLFWNVIPSTELEGQKDHLKRGGFKGSQMTSWPNALLLLNINLKCSN